MPTQDQVRTTRLIGDQETCSTAYSKRPDGTLTIEVNRAASVSQPANAHARAHHCHRAAAAPARCHRPTGSGRPVVGVAEWMPRARVTLRFRDRRAQRGQPHLALLEQLETRAHHFGGRAEPTLRDLVADEALEVLAEAGVDLVVHDSRSFRWGFYHEVARARADSLC